MTDPQFQNYLEKRAEEFDRRAKDKKVSMTIYYTFAAIFFVLIFVNIPIDIAEGTFRWIDKLLICILETQVGNFYRRDWYGLRLRAYEERQILARVAHDEG